LWREEATNDENGKKLIKICKKCLMINPLERYHDGGQLLNVLEGRYEDEENLERKEQEREILSRFQQMLLGKKEEAAIEAMKSNSTKSSSSKRPTNLNEYDSSVETTTAARTTMTMTTTNQRKNGNDDD
jgi:hypothetical protein